MSTMEQQGVGADHHEPQDMDAAVEAQMGKIMTELGGALGVLLTSLGTRSGLWAALAGAGPLTTEEVAAKVLVDPALVREWLRAQAAGGYLDYDPVGGTFPLPDAVAAAIHEGPGGPLVDAAATMMSSMGEGFGEFSEAFSTGRGFGWHQRTAEHWHGTDAFTRVALPTELIAAAIDELERRRVGTDQRWLGGGRRLRLRHTDIGDCRVVPGGHRAGHRLPRRLDRACSRRGGRDRRRQRPVRGRRGHRAARWRLRSDHLLRLVARHRGRRRGTSRGQGGARIRRVRCWCSSRWPPTTCRATSTRSVECSTPYRRSRAHPMRSRSGRAPHRSRWAPKPVSSGSARWPRRPASPESAGPVSRRR